MTERRAKAAAAWAAVLALATLALGAAPSPANPVPDLQRECPEIMPLESVRTGMRGTAISVVRGRNPVAFGAEVLGVLRDAVGPGRDIIIVELSGNAVVAAGGLWAGASGSPVFLREGGKDKVAGAIAYGLAGGASMLAGLTPAEDMNELLQGGGGGELAGTVRVPTSLARRISGATGLSVAQVSAFERLRTPLSASGLNDRGLRRMQDAIDRQGLPFIAYKGSSSNNPPPPPSPPTGLRAGDSFAAALSLGDVTVAGVGTTTWVCQGRAVAFGHPMGWTGKTTLAARAAETITIVPDPVFGGYKLANIAENAGVVTQDRLAGIVAELGPGPEGSPITSTVRDLDTGRARTGRSEAILPEFLPFLAFSHLFQNVDVTIDRIGGGNAEVAYTIRGTRDAGAEWELTRSSRYASRFDVSFESVLELSFTAELLQAFDGEDVDVTGIDVPQLDIEEAYEAYRLQRVLVWNGSKYVRREAVRRSPGQLVRLRAVLKPAHLPGTQTVDFRLRVPASARRSGWIEVVGGGSTFAEVPCFFEEEECGEEADAQTFDQLLAAFEQQPRGDELVARLRLGRSGAVRASSTSRQDAVVTGRALIALLLVR
ncbi:MAG TPA: hypothetical protein VD704_05620 [Gaiellaceae bacterium]|nr:hypothetical protein [Gaiellaceae bacterium]